MSTTPEGKIKEQVKKLFKRYGCYYHMPVQNGMGAPTLDFIACVPMTVTSDMVGLTIGMYVAVETKAPGKKPTPRQELTIQDMQKASGSVFVVDGAVAQNNLAMWVEWVTGNDHERSEGA